MANRNGMGPNKQGSMKFYGRANQHMRRHGKRRCYSLADENVLTGDTQTLSSYKTYLEKELMLTNARLNQRIK